MSEHEDRLRAAELRIAQLREQQAEYEAEHARLMLEHLKAQLVDALELELAPGGKPN